MPSKYDPKVMDQIKEYFKKHPEDNPRSFQKANPQFKKITLTAISYHATKARKELGFVHKQGNPQQRTSQTRFRTLLPIWRYSLKDFEDDPLAALKNFVESLAASRRASFELIKIELPEEDSNKWTPTLEVRETQR